MSTAIQGRIDEVDYEIEKIHRLIDGASRYDPELAAGLGSGEDLSSVQRKIDKAMAACEALNEHHTKLLRGQ